MLRRPFFLLFALVAVATVACSSNDQNNTTPAPGSSGVTTPKVGTTLEQTGDLAAEAKTAVTEFFEKKAVNNYDDARKASSAGARLTIDWAADVNAIKAVDKTPYALPPTAAPNVRVQIDSVEKNGDRYTATGFVELGARPSGVASTTTTSTTTAPGVSAAPTTYFVTDLVFAKSTGGGLTVDDYRLDDTPYPVSQLFTDFHDTKSGSTTGTTVKAGSSGTTAGSAVDVELRLGHRDLDGSVQYDLKYKGADGTKMTKAAFVAKPASTSSTTAKGAAAEVDATVYADAISGGEAGALVVRPGAFPGEPGTLRLTFEDAQKKTTVVEVPAPEWPELTPRPVNQVRDKISASSTTSSTSSTTSTTGVPSTVTVTVPGPTVTVTVTTPTTTKASTSTSSSTSTTTAP